MSAEKVISIAEKDIGLTEYPPNSNLTKYGAEYGMDGYPWCDEVWVPVAGYNGRYEVSNKGRVRNADGRILKPIQRRGYLCLNLSDGKEIKDRKIHRLVAEAFIANPTGFQFVNHKDEDKHNNAADNLEWCDSEYNANYGTRNERVSKSLKSKHYKISEMQKKQISIARSKRVVGTNMVDGSEIVFDSATEAQLHGFTRLGVCHTATGRQKSHRGYIWRFAS